MDPLWCETCLSTFKYFTILIVSTYCILCIGWVIQCLTGIRYLHSESFMHKIMDSGRCDLLQTELNGQKASKKWTSFPSASIKHRQWIPKTHERREVTIVSNGIRLLHLWDCSLSILLFFRDIREGVGSTLEFSRFCDVSWHLLTMLRIKSAAVEWSI